MEDKKDQAAQNEVSPKELKEWETPKLVAEEIDEVTEGGAFPWFSEGAQYSS